jgi:hypothetical protein
MEEEKGLIIDGNSTTYNLKKNEDIFVKNENKYENLRKSDFLLSGDDIYSEDKSRKSLYEQLEGIIKHLKKKRK